MPGVVRHEPKQGLHQWVYFRSGHKWTDVDHGPDVIGVLRRCPDRLSSGERSPNNELEMLFVWRIRETNRTKVLPKSGYSNHSLIKEGVF
jgi:hypothetical protein